MTETTAAQPRIAWAIHIFTASGILAGFFGLLSALDGSPRASLLWMMVAMIIDGLDGPIARKYDVSTVLPMIDGHVMDLVIDYVTCVVAPAFFIHEFHLLPAKFDIVGTGLILLTSLYLFSYTHIQTEDCYFNPIRVRDFRKITIPVLVIWIGAMTYLTWILDDRLAGCTESCLPIGARAAQGIVYLGTIWIVGVGVWRTFAGRRDTHTRAATA